VPSAPTSTPAQRRYLLVRDGVDHGPYEPVQLEEMLRNGTLRSVDSLHPTDGAEDILVVDVPGLRQICEQLVSELERKRKNTAGPKPLHAPVGSSSRSPWATLAIVIAVLAVFAVAGWVLWQRSGGAA
jgi:hypothetical protein